MKVKHCFLVLYLLSVQLANACPLCEKRQPKITQGFTHGIGPTGNWEWIIVSGIAFVTLLAFIFSVKYLIKPCERNSDHIKQSILNY